MAMVGRYDLILEYVWKKLCILTPDVLNYSFFVFLLTIHYVTKILPITEFWLFLFSTKVNGFKG